MARVTVELPSLLRAAVGGARSLPLEARSLAHAIERIAAEYPTLYHLVCDEQGALRQHVLCFLNEMNSRWLEGDRELKDGDAIRFLQAVSGG